MVPHPALQVTALLFTVAVAGDLASAQTHSLIEAVKQGHRAAITASLQRGSDVNATETDGTTALHWAAQNGDLETVAALIRAKAAVDARNQYGVTPMWLAATNGHADVAEALLRAGADPRATRASSGETALMIAAMAGHASVVRLLLASGADPNAVDSHRQQTALMWAAGERHDAVVRLLADAGVKLEARSQSGLTALMFAIRAGDIPTTMTLLDLGADLKASAPDGTTTLVLAIINAHWELAARLVERGADPNGTDPRGRPLHVLAFMRRAQNRGLTAWLPRRPTGKIDSLTLAKVLVARGAKVNDRIDWKNPSYLPTHMALNQVELTSYVGATPLYIAAKNCDAEFVKFLAANGADPALSNIQKITPLLAASGVGYIPGEAPGTPEEALETVKVLVSLGNDLHAAADFGSGQNAPTGGGWNGAGALHGAILRGDPALVTWLIAQGVQLDRKNVLGDVPLDFARGATLGINLHVWPELAAILEAAMRDKGLPVPEPKKKNYNQLGSP